MIPSPMPNASLPKMIFEYDLVQLPNGVKSVRSRGEAETFHPVIGPVEEARLLYVEQLKIAERAQHITATAQRELVLWDVGLGAAANVLTVLEALKHLRARIRIVSFDHTLEALRFAIANAAELAYPEPYANELSTLAENRTVAFRRNNLEIAWEVHVADFPTLLSSPGAANWAKPDAILFDAFSPAKNPAMWTLPLFARIFELLDPQRPCALPTYSRSTMLRVTLLRAGFYVGAGAPIAEKEETTIAANSLSLLANPLPSDWLKRARNSTCAEPLTQPTYTRQPISETTWEALKTHPQFKLP